MQHQNPQPLVWTARQCAAALGMSYNKFLASYRDIQGFPRPLAMGNQAQRRWSVTKVQKFVDGEVEPQDDIEVERGEIVDILANMKRRACT